MTKTHKNRNPKYCHLCGQRLLGQGWVYIPHNTPQEQSLILCQDCRENAPRCEICGLPMGKHYKQLPDGRKICPHCSRTAIFDPTHAQTYFKRVVDVVTEQLGLKLQVGAEFALVDPEHLQHIAKEIEQEPSTDSENVIGLFVRQGAKRVMYVLSGLPQVMLIHTIAHEWAHAWQGENCPLLKSPSVREGFAEWIAYKTLLAMGKSETSRKRAPDLYQEGLQNMLRLEQEKGIDGVLTFCRQAE